MIALIYSPDFQIILIFWSDYQPVPTQQSITWSVKCIKHTFHCCPFFFCSFVRLFIDSTIQKHSLKKHFLIDSIHFADVRTGNIKLSCNSRIKSPRRNVWKPSTHHHMESIGNWSITVHFPNFIYWWDRKIRRQFFRLLERQAPDLYNFLSRHYWTNSAPFWTIDPKKKSIKYFQIVAMTLYSVNWRKKVFLYDK